MSLNEPSDEVKTEPDPRPAGVPVPLRAPEPLEGQLDVRRIDPNAAVTYTHEDCPRIRAGHDLHRGPAVHGGAVTDGVRHQLAHHGGEDRWISVRRWQAVWQVKAHCAAKLAGHLTGRPQQRLDEIEGYGPHEPAGGRRAHGCGQEAVHQPGQLVRPLGQHQSGLPPPRFIQRIPPVGEGAGVPLDHGDRRA